MLFKASPNGKPSAGVKELQGKDQTIDFHNIKLPKDDEEILEGKTFLSEELRECLLNLPPLNTMDNLLTINNIVNHQSTDLPLLNKIVTEPHNFRHKEMEGYKVVHTRLFKDRSEIWKITIPLTLLPQLLQWYHLVLGQCGQQQLYNTFKA